MTTSEALDYIYNHGWGRQWPRHDGTISKTDIGIPRDIERTDEDDVAINIPDRWDYTCLENIRLVARALGIMTKISDFLVIRSEYYLLRDMIERRSSTGAFVVTGQPGIGKTMFLIYLLLYRLEHKLPTAIQVGHDRYFVFDDECASLHRTVDEAEPRLSSCWALADSNLHAAQPCEHFLSQPEVLIQSSSPKPERWKDWLNQKMGARIYAELPTLLEIAAILHELHSVSSFAFRLVTKWGPSTRTIISIAIAMLQDPENAEENEENQQAEAEWAAHKLCSARSLVASKIAGGGISDSYGSAIGFVRPHRRFASNGEIAASSRAIWFIPTTFLDEIFAKCCTNFSNEKSHDLFIAFSSHSLTRTTAGWQHEMNVHRRLTTVGVPPLTIFNHDRSEEMQMHPSAHLVPGTAAGLKQTSADEAFYWMPSVINWEGIDGVLGDTDNNVYAVQATIASDHSSPAEGLKKAWLGVAPSVRSQRRWHLVVVADNIAAAGGLVNQFSSQLKDFKLGPGKGVRVQVWGCVLD